MCILLFFVLFFVSFFVSLCTCKDIKETLDDDINNGKLVLISDEDIESRELGKYMLENGVTFSEYNVVSNPETLEYTKERYGDLVLPTLIHNKRVEKGITDSTILLKSLNSAYKA